MAQRHGNLNSLYKAQLARFTKVNATLHQAVDDIADMAGRDIDELTNATPQGSARIAMLRALGNPLGRGASPSASTPTGRKRAGRRRGGIKGLPIGVISGGLRRASFVRRIGSRVRIGFGPGAGGAIYRVMPGGTSKMVDAGLWAPGERGELGKRIKARRLALSKHISKAMRS